VSSTSLTSESIVNTLSPCDNIVSLAVGATPDIVRVHEGVLCKSSSYFQRAMKPEWAELREDPHTIVLPDESLDIVKLYVQWLYSGSLGIPVAPTEKRPTYSEVAEAILIVLAEAYVFGEKRLDVSFKNAVLEIFAQVSTNYHWIPGPEALAVIIAGTCPSSPLRRFALDQLAHHASDRTEWDNEVSQYSHEVAIEVLRAIVKKRQPSKVRWEVSLKDYLEKVDI
jgi:hypothetical protein